MQFIETHRASWCIPKVSLPRKKNGHMTSIPSMKRGRLLCGAVWERQALHMLPALHSKLQGPHTLVSFFLQKHDNKIPGQGLPRMGPEEVYWACTQLNSHIPNPSLLMRKYPQSLYHARYSRYAITYKITEPSKSEAVKATLSSASSNPSHLGSAANHRTFFLKKFPPNHSFNIRTQYHASR